MWVSAQTLLLNRVVLLWICAFFLIYNPEAVYKNIYVLAIGHSLPQVYVGSGDALASLVATLFAAEGLQDFVLLFEDRYLETFRVILPARLIVYFAVSALSYMKVASFAVGPLFTYCFTEILMNFWIFSAIREEMNEKLRVAIRSSAGTTS